MHVDFLVEDESTQAALEQLLPKAFGDRVGYRIHPFGDKPTLLERLPNRLKGYAKWIANDYRIVVLVDEDRDDCRQLKRTLDAAVRAAGLTSRSQNPTGHHHVVTRIAVEELEAWFFGDVQALADAYPGVPRSLASRAPYRDPDAIRGGTWERLEAVLKQAGYYKAGIPKREVATRVAGRMDPARNTSKSFQAFWTVVAEIAS